jgi:transcriptional regulator with XRE-family HTH domain
MVQQELADKLGKPQSFVAKVERGERRIDVIEFLAIAKAIGRDPMRLLKQYLTQEPPSKPRSVAGR